MLLTFNSLASISLSRTNSYIPSSVWNQLCPRRWLRCPSSHFTQSPVSSSVMAVALLHQCCLTVFMNPELLRGKNCVLPLSRDKNCVLPLSLFPSPSTGSVVEWTITLNRTAGELGECNYDFPASYPKDTVLI